MLFSIKKSILLSIFILLFSSCADKTNGKYHTKYSYHPYYSLYAQEMSNTPPKKKKSKVSLISNKKNRFPSNTSTY